jgi:hypothetical protein
MERNETKVYEKKVIVEAKMVLLRAKAHERKNGSGR